MKNWINNNDEAILAKKQRAEEKYWYVLFYNPKTTEYGNEIVFHTLKEAEDIFENVQPTKDYRVEIIFSPASDDKNFFDNVLIKYKEA